MLTVYAYNLTKNLETSDYEVVVVINEEAVWKGVVKGHERARGWQQLLREIAEAGSE